MSCNEGFGPDHTTPQPILPPRPPQNKQTSNIISIRYGVRERGKGGTMEKGEGDVRREVGREGEERIGEGREGERRYTLQGKFHLCIPFLGIARPQSQFPHSCVCEQFIYSHDPSTYFPPAE